MFLNFSPMKYARNFGLFIGVSVFSASAFANGTPATEVSTTPPAITCDGEESLEGRPNSVIAYHHVRLEKLESAPYQKYAIEFYERHPGAPPSYQLKGRFGPEANFAVSGGSGMLVVVTASPLGVYNFSISLLENDHIRINPNEYAGHSQLSISFPGVSGTGIGSELSLQCRIPNAFMRP